MSEPILTHGMLTSKRGRIEVYGSFTTNGTGAPTDPTGDGVVTRSAQGIYDVTLPVVYGKVDAIFALISEGDNPHNISIKCSFSGRVLKVHSFFGGTEADSTGNRIAWVVRFDTRADL